MTGIETTVRRYFDLLTAGDTKGIITLFAPEGQVTSPFLGVVPAPEFYAKLAQVSRQSRLTVHDVLTNPGQRSAAARFRYDWTLADGSKTMFEGVDYFRFDPAGQITQMLIYYDTHPLRAEVGDKYARD